MNAYRIKNVDFPLGNFDFAKEILSNNFTPSIGGYVGSTMRNSTFHTENADNARAMRQSRLTIWGDKRVDYIEINNKPIWRRHWWVMRIV
jgi:hypothetical protein